MPGCSPLLHQFFAGTVTARTHRVTKSAARMGNFHGRMEVCLMSGRHSRGNSSPAMTKETPAKEWPGFLVAGAGFGRDAAVMKAQRLSRKPWYAPTQD
jgi:hypothetical protein